MNIVDVISRVSEATPYIRRRVWGNREYDGWYDCVNNGRGGHLSDGWSLNDILADDWEHKEHQILISKTALWEIARSIFVEYEPSKHNICESFTAILSRKLGLEEQ